MNRHVRKAALVTAAITAGLLMTACQNGSASSGSSGDGAKNGSGSQHRSASKTSGHGTSAGSSAKRGSAAAARNASSTGHGVTGAFAGGTVSYLAPGKYLVHAPGKTDQEFYVADDTAVYGAGKVCGSPRSEARPRCTLDQLEAAAKKGVSAKVVIADGVATSVTEDR